MFSVSRADCSFVCKSIHQTNQAGAAKCSFPKSHIHRVFMIKTVFRLIQFMLPTYTSFGLLPDDGTAVFFWRVFQGGMGVAALYRWLSRWQEIHLVSAFRIYCAHTKSAFLAHIACLIRCRLIRFMAGSFTADLYRY